MQSVVTSTGKNFTLNLRLNLNLKPKVLIISQKLGAKLQLSISKRGYNPNP